MWAAWAAGILAFACAASLIGAEGPSRVDLVSWAAGALMLAAFPAGVAAGPRAVRWEGDWIRSLAAFAVATIALAAVVFAVRGYVGPALLPDAVGEPVTWSLGERVAAARAAERTAAEQGTVEAWKVANEIAWHADMTVTSAIATLAFAWVGALLGAWLPAALGREIRYAVCAAAGLFLLVTGYLITENGYELILLRMAGPAAVTAWLPLIAPGMLAAGLAVPTLIRLVSRPP